MNPTIHLILSYCKAHIYELHSILAALPTFIIVQLIKRPIKRYSLAKYGCSDIRRRFNTIIILIAMIVGAICYSIVAAISPLVDITWFSAVTTGVVTVTFYVLLESLGIIGFFRKRGNK